MHWIFWSRTNVAVRLAFVLFGFPILIFTFIALFHFSLTLSLFWLHSILFSLYPSLFCSLAFGLRFLSLRCIPFPIAIAIIMQYSSRRSLAFVVSNHFPMVFFFSWLTLSHSLSSDFSYLLASFFLFFFFFWCRCKRATERMATMMEKMPSPQPLAQCKWCSNGDIDSFLNR